MKIIYCLVMAAALTLSLHSARALGTPSAQTDIGADIVVTAAPAYVPLAALTGGERFPEGAQLLIIRDGKAEPLLANFYAAADANVSFDGKRILFSGKQNASDAWQIWEMTFADRSLRRLIADKGDAIRPLYLPYGRLVYARRLGNSFRLEAAGNNAAGTDAARAMAPIDAQAGETVQQLSFLPGSTIPDDVLLDGRILFESEFPLGTGTTPELYLVYSDGSGVESYRCDHGRARWAGKQLASGDVVFTHGGSLARFTSPLAHEAVVQAPRGDYAGAIAETASGAWLLSARSTPASHYSLKLGFPATSSQAASPALKTVLAVSGENLVEPVIVAPRTRPKRHPSGLHDWSYANMMALDARISRDGDLKIAPAEVSLETLDANGRTVSLGTAPVESDGSFLVRTPADQPIRFAVLDAKGAVVRQEHGWFWIRRGEQRYCVGCHAGPERSPDNHVPAVLLRTTTPVDLTGSRASGDAQSSASKGN
jgi:hypothetical protein